MKPEAPFAKLAPTRHRRASAFADCILSVSVLGEPAREFTVLVSDEAVGRFFEQVIRLEFGAKYRLRFLRFLTFDELLPLADKGFDAAVIYLNGAFFEATDQSYWDYVRRSIPVLAAFKRCFGKPVFAYQGVDLEPHFRGTGVGFIPPLCPAKEVRRLFRLSL